MILVIYIIGFIIKNNLNDIKTSLIRKFWNKLFMVRSVFYIIPMFFSANNCLQLLNSQWNGGSDK